MNSNEIKRIKIKCNRLIDIALQLRFESEEKDLLIKELQGQLQKALENNSCDNVIVDSVDECSSIDSFCEEEIPEIIQEQVTKPEEEVIYELTQEELDREELGVDEEVIIVYDKGFLRKTMSVMGVIILMIFIAILIIIFTKIIYMEV